MAFENPSREEIKRILEESNTVAIVGCSDNPARDSYNIAAAMKAKGYRIIPVNPNADTILGEKAYPSLRDIPEPVDIVDVFRRPEHTPDIAREAVEIGAKTLWLQLGVVNEEAAEIAKSAGLHVIMDRCIKVEDSILLPHGKG
jgi:predicted CoA-binding protein